MNKKIEGKVFYLVSVCFYIVALIHIISSDASDGVIWLCLGSAFLCLGVNATNKANKNGKENEEKKKE